MLIESFRVEEIMHFLGWWLHFPQMLLKVLHPVEHRTTWCDLGSKQLALRWVENPESSSDQSLMILSSHQDHLDSIYLPPVNLCSEISKVSFCQLHTRILSQSAFPTSHDPFNISIPGRFCPTTSLTLLSVPMCTGIKKKCWWLNILCMLCKFMCDKSIRDCRQGMW